MSLTFGQALLDVEEKLQRRLTPDEIELLGRMVDAEKDLEEILAVLDAPVAAPPEDDGLETYRYEATGAGVVPIPDNAPDEEGEPDDQAL